MGGLGNNSKIENRKSKIPKGHSVENQLRIALFTYSTKPRGGVVHTLSLAEQLQTLGHAVHIFALGKDQQGSFFRPTPAPFTLIPAGTGAENEPLDERIQRYIQTYYQFLSRYRPDSFDIYHAQDCISANALWRAREDGLLPWFVRTVHHIDDFISPVLIECQNHSIYRPNYRLVVSDYWRQRLAAEFGVDSTVIHNGVDPSRFHPPSLAERTEARARLGLGDQWVFLNIGGIEPGVPVLTSDLPVFREYLQPGQNALLVDPFDEQAIAAGMLRLVEDDPLRQRLAAAGPTTARRFSWAATAQAHGDYYWALLAERIAVG
ncbi:MAG: glycosyltransferase [Chloroflexi bacterium]|nr:glycosyltransferase [Chloroflexota bacterium]